MDQTHPDKDHDGAKAAWLRSGRDPQAFEQEWPKIRERLIARRAEVIRAQQSISRRWLVAPPPTY